ncbi:aromatic ring-hydroxylating dioxygenase subunit alpha [Novosphingobium sp.]|uniref:aromatic ring-hydroxylating dioxygenase subunit alpha n=1 Tax=Novosphingobium sp. TaxID=1874826 RepID=UPI00262F6DEA|nr:aromatic ring-hydroxylating dioxygenase subunit alpha [Novosphingobium sp.]
MLIRNCWYVAGWSYELEAGKPLQRMLLGEPVVLWRRSDGTVVAMEDRCVHRLAPLSHGRIEGDSIRCLYHGMRFEAGGRCAEIPGQDMIPPNACVRTYPVVEQNDWIWVWMGDIDRADPSRVAPSKALTDPAWVLKTGQLHYEAHYELINDNLLDLTHLSYVHAASFGADLSWSNTRAKVEAIPEGVRSSRWLVGSPPIPPLGKAAEHTTVDIWTTYDFVLPGVFLLYTALFPAGTAAACGGLPPSDDLPSLHSNFTSQAVTPTSGTTTTYYYSWGPAAQHGDEAMAQLMIDIATMAFNEDKVMIEAQQRVISADPSRRPVPTTADKAITLFTRLMRAQDKDPVERDAETKTIAAMEIAE